MVTEPAATPVTKPVLDTVAIAVLLDVQGLEAAGLPLPVNWVVLPTQTEVVPVMVGRGFTVIVTVVEVAVQPPALVSIAL